MKKPKYLFEGKKVNNFSVGKLLRINGNSRYECICICGNKRYITGYDLNISRYKSCGCVNDHLSENYEKLFHDKFWNQTKLCESGCIEWTGLSREGYGRINYKGKTCGCTRLVWEWKNGPIEKGNIICHKCDNPCCVNIDHLFVGTKKENRKDCVYKKRHATLNGSKNPQSKLKEEDVPNIREMLKKGISAPKIAEKYQVGASSIKRIRHNLTWKHIP